MVKVLSLLALFVFVLVAYAQQSQDHHHRMSPQVHRCMKVMDDPKYMEEMLEYMLQKREEVKKILEKNPNIRKYMEDALK
ncbi:hypothetical protein [Thermocrinis sp.]|uniref:hypothetical protein n=1 Tax=Thermocrinis sp. TaxID=2024383 RepID=UPI002FDD099D